MWSSGPPALPARSRATRVSDPVWCGTYLRRSSHESLASRCRSRSSLIHTSHHLSVCECVCVSVLTMALTRVCTHHGTHPTLQCHIYVWLYRSVVSWSRGGNLYVLGFAFGNLGPERGERRPKSSVVAPSPAPCPSRSLHMT